MLGANGGLIGGTRTASALGSGVGLWTPNEQAALRRNRSWPLSGDPFYSYTSLLLSMDGTNGSTTFTDSSLNALTVTANGNAQITTAQSKFGGASAAFDGTGDYVVMPHNSVLSIESGDFTIEAWIYRSASGAIHNIINKRISTPASGYGWRINANNTLQFFFLGGSSITSTSTVSASSWVHLAVTRSANTVRQFINGTLDATTATFSSGTSNTQEVRIGIDEIGGDGFNGYIDDLRITKGVARYTANFTPPTQAHLTYGGYNDPYFVATSLLLHMDGSNGSTTFTDSSLNALTVTPNGNAQISTSQSKFGGSSGLFDGSGDFLTASSPALSANWTIELWVYPTVANQQTFISFNSGSFQGINIWMNTSRQLVVDDGANAQSAFTGAALALNAWSHVAVARSGVTTTGYINGVSVGSNSFTPQSVNSVNIGRYNGGSFPYFFNGYLDEVRVTIGVARYTANFTPPSAPFPDL